LIYHLLHYLLLFHNPQNHLHRHLHLHFAAFLILAHLTLDWYIFYLNDERILHLLVLTSLLLLFLQFYLSLNYYSLCFFYHSLHSLLTMQLVLSVTVSIFLSTMTSFNLFMNCLHKKIFDKIIISYKNQFFTLIFIQKQCVFRCSFIKPIQLQLLDNPSEFCNRFFIFLLPSRFRNLL